MVFIPLVMVLGYAAYILAAGLGAFSFNTLNVLQAGTLFLIFWLPSLAARLAAWWEGAGQALPELAALPFRKVLRMAAAVVVVFAVIHTLITLLGFSQPEWEMRTLANALSQELGKPLDASSAAAVPFCGLVLMPLLSMLLGATVFAAAALGNEWGWRGYLLPRLQFLGRRRAHFVSGLAWGLWLLPFVHAWHRSNNLEAEFLPFSLRFLAFALVFSTVLNEIFLRSHQVLLCAVCLGVFLAQLQSSWDYLFPVVNPPWTGAFGIVALAVWALLALFPQPLVGRIRN
ncbi:MAG: hypothetical protein HYZ00_10370 [Candidatus Hydrogenedentes bacterium]|nr:hypothetical protein [Candidatus Hydrogenedentota bacterium]